ncbi:methyltransferase [Shewanella corallii]|uniref:tRNA1(Val) (adenine(37)-N6)-methyltransferase n=2 Tax=Shewanella corallii TaxID=560080 RepID=A0ABT0N553_9GAMM|nr:methyltransferase [Shewanella corallii]
MPFTFKQFHIDDQGCGMPVSTDAVVLGAWAPLTQAKQILDIGAGSGLLSLMAAQRSTAHITAVEIDDAAIQACQRNIDASPWADRISLIAGDISEIATKQSQRFDHIICNPPYFETGPQSDKTGRATARHTDKLTFAALTRAFDGLLSEQGKITLIMPIESLAAWNKALEQTPQLTLLHQCDVVSVRGKVAKRVLLLLGRNRATPVQSQLVLREPNNSYSQEMIALTRDFYLFM